MEKDNEIEFLKEKNVIDSVEWDYFEKIDFDEFSKDENVQKLQKYLKNERYQKYLQYSSFKKMQNLKKETHEVQKKIEEFAKIKIEFTTERDVFPQGEFVMKKPMLVIGCDNKKKKDESYLNLYPYFENMRTDTRMYISKRHCTIMYDKEKEKFIILNHSQNGTLVDLLLVIDEPFSFVGKAHEIRIGEIKVNQNITSFTYNTINMKIEFLV